MTWDEMLCWPETPAGSRAIQNCPSYVNDMNKGQCICRQHELLQSTSLFWQLTIWATPQLYLTMTWTCIDIKFMSFIEFTLDII